MSLADFGFASCEALRSTTRNNHGELVCPVCSNPVGHTDDLLEVPVQRLENDTLRDRLEDHGCTTVRTRGYECHVDDLLLPRTVSGRNAAGFSSETWVGARAEFGNGRTRWIPVLQEDLPASIDELEARDERTRVGMWMHDECNVYAGRANGGESHLLNTEPGDRGWLGNPYSVDEFGREQAISLYTHAIVDRCERDVAFRNALGDLQGTGTVLGCWCRRLDDDEPSCHCDVLVRLIDDALIPIRGGERA